MNNEQLKGLFRTVVAVAGGYALAKGWITSTQMQALNVDTLIAIGGAVVSIAVGAWSTVAHSKSNIVQAAAKLPEVTQVRLASTPEGQALGEAVKSTAEATITVGKENP